MACTFDFQTRTPYPWISEFMALGWLAVRGYFCPILKDLAKTIFKIIVSL